LSGEVIALVEVSGVVLEGFRAILAEDGRAGEANEIGGVVIEGLCRREIESECGAAIDRLL